MIVEPSLGLNGTVLGQYFEIPGEASKSKAGTSVCRRRAVHNGQVNPGGKARNAESTCPKKLVVISRARLPFLSGSFLTFNFELGHSESEHPSVLDCPSGWLSGSPLWIG